MLIPSAKSLGRVIATSIPISQNVKQSDVIIIGQILSCPQNVAKDVQNTAHTNLNSENQVFNTQDAIQPPGIYNIEVLSAIKGKSKSSLHLMLPELSKLYYNFADMNISKGNKILLLLNTDAKGELLPTDPTIPLVKLSDGDQLLSHTTVVGDPLLMTIRVLIQSLSEVDCRQANTYLLRDTVQPEVVTAMSGFINDPNIYVRNNVLYCLVSNQVVTSIPRLTQLIQMAHSDEQGLDCALSIQKLTNKNSVPYLNKLLLQSNESLRINTMFTLPEMADCTSIPYLVLALRDPEPQGIVSYGAYVSLTRLIAALKSSHQSHFGVEEKIANLSDFIANRERFTHPLYDWWNDDLMGIHFRKVGQANERSVEQATDEIGQLNLETFAPNPSERLKSVKRLMSKANKTSIPFLVLALQDPDADVAYLAYKTLHRLIPTLGATKSATVFSAKRTAVSQPLYDWWRDELLGKHLSS